MISVAICDDDKKVTHEIYERLSYLRAEYSISLFYSAEELLRSGKKFDLFFLDIELPGLNGMELAKQIRKSSKNTYIIFLTNHSEYIAEAFKVRAYRFLVKPIEQEELVESITQLELEIFKDEKILIKSDDKTDLINIDDIICIEAFGDGSIIYTTVSNKESNRSLKFWTENLPTEHFYRVHKTFLVSYKYVKTIEKKSLVMYRLNNPIPISRRNYSDFKKSFIEYIKIYSKYI